MTGALDLMSQMADLALKEPGIVACLVQGMGAHADVASLLFLFASDMELFSFSQNQQVLAWELSYLSRCHLPYLQQLHWVIES